MRKSGFVRLNQPVKMFNPALVVAESAEQSDIALCNLESGKIAGTDVSSLK